MVRIAGFDLGTTFSAVAVVNDLGKPQIIVNREGERITPSVVLFQGDLVQVGTQAKRMAPMLPDDVAQFVKRSMGDKAWRFVTSVGKEYTAEQVSAFILRRLKEDAERALGYEITDAVITVPAYFDDARRTATMDAGTIAGMTVRRVLNEPTAAALSFGLDTDFVGTVMVYDLGGGTFDVTLMRIDADHFDVIATEGDRNLGGFDWDNRIMQLLNEKALAQGAPDLLEDDRMVAELRDKAELAKRTLSSIPEARVFIAVDGRSLSLSVTRAEFEERSRDLLERTSVIVEAVLEDANLTWAEVDKILLVGGSIRMPMVQASVRRMSGKEPDLTANPDEAVALGAAIQAHLLAVADPSTTAGSRMPVLAGRPIAVSDVTSQSLGVIVQDRATGREVNSIIIPHNEKVPVKRSEQYSTVVPNQTMIDLRVTEGDDPDPEYVTIIHRQPISIPPYPQDAPIEVVMSYDVDARIHIEVRDLTAGRTLGEIDLDRPSNLEREQVTAMARDMREQEVD